MIGTVTDGRAARAAAAIVLVSVVALAAAAAADAATIARKPVTPAVSRSVAARSTPACSATPRPTPVASDAEIEDLGRRLRSPIAGLAAAAIHDTFAEMRGEHRHEASDILAPRGTPVLAVDDGVVAKLFNSVPGGLTVYQFSAEGTWCFYYAHLDAYAAGVREGTALRAGDVLGYVGTTGNAGATPHLHFAIFKLGPERRWWEGTPIDPYPLLRVEKKF